MESGDGTEQPEAKRRKIGNGVISFTRYILVLEGKGGARGTVSCGQHYSYHCNSLFIMKLKGVEPSSSNNLHHYST